MLAVAEPDAPTDDSKQTAAAADVDAVPSPPSAPQFGVDAMATLSVAEAKIETSEEAIMAESESAPPKTPEPERTPSTPAAATCGNEENADIVNVPALVEDDKMAGKRERIEDGATDEMLPDAKVPTPSKAEPHVGCTDNVACAAPIEVSSA
jgi:hypothetical protein